MKQYLDMIVNNGKTEDMECLGNMLIDLIDKSEDSKKYKSKIIGMAYNYTINEELARDIVEDMKPLGEYWDRDTIISVVGNVPNINDIYVVMNSLVNDYGNVIPKDEVETYKNMTIAWLNDEDGHTNKVWWYFVK